MMMTTTNERNNVLFNTDDKERFITDMIKSETISEETSKSYIRILTLASMTEELLGKDLNQFSLEELEEVLFGFRANTRNTVESYARIISSYLNWSVQTGLAEENKLADLKPNDFIKYMTHSEEYFTERQIRRWEDRMENYQDAVAVRLLFLGVGGKQMSELRNLKKQDIDRKNKRIRLVNTLRADKNGLPINSTVRYLDIEDEHTFDLIEGAIKIRTYVKRNGEVGEGNEARSIGKLDLVENDYVIRASITKTENYDFPVDKFVIYRRIQMLSEVMGIEKFTAKHIQRSGMIYIGSKLMQDDYLSLDNLKEVAGIFDMKSYHNLKGFLTAENILKTYPRD